MSRKLSTNLQLIYRQRYPKMPLPAVIFYLLILLVLFSKGIALPAISSRKGLDSLFDDFSQTTYNPESLEFANLLDNQQLTDGWNFRNEGMENQSSLPAIERDKPYHVHQAFNRVSPKVWQCTMQSRHQEDLKVTQIIFRRNDSR
jgi:hypothetical protein